MACGNRSVWTEITFVAFFAFVRFGVHLVGVAVLIGFVASATFQRLLHGSVQFLDVDSQVCFAATGGWTKFTVEHRFIADLMDQLVSLQRIGLGESSMADVTFVWFLAGVDSKVSLQFEGVRGGVCAMWTLIWTFSSVATDMAFEFAQFYACVITFRAFMWFFVGVTIAHVAD